MNTSSLNNNIWSCGVVDDEFESFLYQQDEDEELMRSISTGTIGGGFCTEFQYNNGVVDTNSNNQQQQQYFQQQPIVDGNNNLLVGGGGGYFTNMMVNSEQNCIGINNSFNNCVNNFGMVNSGMNNVGAVIAQPSNITPPTTTTPQVVVLMIEKSEYSCLSCRQLHRKCDKTLPSCSYCLKRGYSCTYEKPRRGAKPNQPKFVFVDGRGKSQRSNESNQSNDNQQLSVAETSPTSREKSSTNSNDKAGNGVINSVSSNQLVTRKAEPYQNIVNMHRVNNSEIQNELNYRFVSTKTLDVYFDVIACGMPLVERKKMEHVLEYQANLYHPSFSTSGCDYYSNQLEFEKDQSLLFTLQALCLQQMGHRDVSVQVFHQGKQILGKYFDDTDSMSVLLAMKFTSLYLLGEGERRKARVMMSTVKAAIEPYLKRNEKLKEITDLDVILKNTKSFTSLMIETQLKLIDLYLYEEIYPDTYLFEAIQEMSSRKMKFSEEEKAKGCKKLDREIYTKLRSIMKALMCLTDIFIESERTETVDNLLMLGLMLTSKQIWLEILINADESLRDLSEILQVSSEIIALTRTRFFPYLQINATKGIILAATLRANYYYKLGPNENINDDLRAIRSLSKKYKYIQTECVDLVKALETLTYMSSTCGSMNLFSVEEIFNFTNSNRISDESSLKPNIEGGVISCYNEYIENHRHVLNQVMEDSDLLDELVNCLLEQDRIKREVIDPIQKIQCLHNRKLQLVKAYRDSAIKKRDVYHVIETELMQKQLVYELEAEKSKLLVNNQPTAISHQL